MIHGEAATEPVVPVVPLDPKPRSFDDFYREEWPRAVRLAALLTQQAGAAEDLAQEAFSRVYVSWQRVISPPAYLRAAVVNACRKWQRHAGVERANLPLVATLDTVEFEGGELADAVAALPFRQRAVIVLRYYGDLSESEIADALGCRRGTVKSLASRALARLNKDISR